MAKYNEQTLDTWRKPASETEEQKISNAISMIKDAINAHLTLKNKNIEFIVQGSYGNNTNIKVDSDIDVCAMLKDTFYSEYREGAKDSDYRFVTGTNSFDDYKKWIIEALIAKFGAANISVGNKAIQIKSNTYRVQADVVAAFQFRNYRSDRSNNQNNFIEGIKFFSSGGDSIINYPKIHIKNGIQKNNDTSRKFKRTVRLYKRIRNKMKEDGVAVPGGICSYLIESLLWNTPNSIFNSSTSWNMLLRESIIFLFNNTKDDSTCKNWGVVSEQFYLFHTGCKWSRAEVNTFLVQMWNYLGYTS
ncbi:MAG TPA: nucleotidyltransferase [Cytophagaceae bacterium]|jgi:hypothetical protein|nr:nucleotidyltransferase [Cytophagaceae bacterium]